MSEAYGGLYMKGHDLNGRPLLVTIEHAEIRKLPDFNNPNQQNDRLILSFTETGKDVAVNATSARVLMAAFGDDERAYIGKQIVLYPEKVNVGGQMREAVMIRLPRGRAPATVPAQMPPIDPTTAGDFDDEIPF
jgi:hypothetical protein